MDCRCLDCGAPFKSGTHTDQCPACNRIDDETYRNVPPNDAEPNLRWRWPEVRLPPSAQRGEVPIAPWPSGGEWFTCACGGSGPRFFRTGLISRRMVCDLCGREEERRYIAERFARSMGGAA